jgi:hypothetical protein
MSYNNTLPYSSQLAEHKQGRDDPITAHLVRSNQVTPDGAAFVSLAVNPFSNEPQRTVGMPDQTSGKSIIYDVREQFTVTKNAGLAAGKWDAHLVFCPAISWTQIGAGSNFKLKNRDCGERIASTDPVGPNQHFSLLKCCQVTEGEETFTHRVVAEYVDEYRGGPLLSNAKSRLIAGGFKVINTTAELYKQGDCTMYQVDCHRSESTHSDDVNALGTFVSRHRVRTFEAPPSTVGAAKQIDSVSQPAAEGALCIFRQNGDNEPVAQESTDMVCLLPDDIGTITREGYGTRTYPVVDASAYACGSRILPFHMHGAYFTGLSDETSLTVTFRLLIEVFPGPGDPTMPLASRAPSYDPVALEIANVALSRMPAGHPAKFNSFGKFARGVLSAIKLIAPVASPFLRVLGGTPGAVAADLIQGKAQAAANKVAAARNKKKKK